MSRFQLSRFDFFRKVPKDLTEASTTGALVSLICFIFVCVLFASEFFNYMRINTISSMYVDINDAKKSEDKLKINLDISVYELPCAVVSLDVQDVLGEHSIDVHQTLKKYRIDNHGDFKYNHENNALIHTENDGDEVLQKQKGEGCRLKGFILVNKVPGNCHISAHSRPDLLLSLLNEKNVMNVSHKINNFAFGSQIQNIKEDIAYSPLNGISRVSDSNREEIVHNDHTHQLIQSGSFEYFLKIVPTIYENLKGNKVRSFQFTSSTNEVKSNIFSAIYFRYDFSPITIHYKEKSESFTSFVVKIFAILGGVFTCFSLIST